MKPVNKKKIGLIIGICFVLLFIVGMLIQSSALYEEEQDGKTNLILDGDFAYTIEDKDGNVTNVETVPERKDYDVTISCDNGATGVWDYEVWGPLIQNLTTTRTKCKIKFTEELTLVDVIKRIPIVTSGNGLYEVDHSSASITYTTDTTAINNLKQTEYRYAGTDPDNYVNFNNELWRVIGLVNTPEGQRIKLIKNESIGEYSWDSSASSVNSGWGVNEWSNSDIMKLLNSGAYYNRTSGTCYNGANNATTSCDFSETGLTEEAKEMIDTVTWNLGSNDGTTYTYNNINTNVFYNIERSKNTGKLCSSGSWCNDTISRTTTWKGQVGLMYPSDYGYATSGGVTTDRSTCLNTVLSSWNSSSVSDCVSNDWLYKSEFYQWTITPGARSDTATCVFYMNKTGFVNSGNAGNAYVSLPTIHLKTSVKIASGNGSLNLPYNLSI